MVLINDKKFACATCIKGHRVSGCTHTDRPLFEVKKKGRPTTQCQHCKDKRKGGSVHTKCACGDIKTPAVILPSAELNATLAHGSPSDSTPSDGTGNVNGVTSGENIETRKGQPGSTPTFPNGLKDVHEMAAAAEALTTFGESPMRVAERSVANLLNPCSCKTTGICKCCQPKRARPEEPNNAPPTSSCCGSSNRDSRSPNGSRTPTDGNGHPQITDSLIEMFKSKATTTVASPEHATHSPTPNLLSPISPVAGPSRLTWSQLMSSSNPHLSPENMHHPAHTSPHVHKTKLYSPYSTNGQSTPRHGIKRDIVSSRPSGWESSASPPPHRPPPPKIRPLADMNTFLGAIFREDGSVAKEIPRSALGLPGIKAFDTMAENGGVKVETMEMEDVDMPLAFPTNEDVVIGACTCGEGCECPGCATHGNPSRSGEHAHDGSCGENCRSCFDCGYHLSLPSGITSISHLLSLAASNVPKPAAPRPTDLNAHDTRILPPAVQVSEEVARSMGFIQLKPLECCNGRCQCPPGKCVCEKDCCGCCVRCACAEDGDDMMNGGEEEAGAVSAKQTQGSSCCGDGASKEPSAPTLAVPHPPHPQNVSSTDPGTKPPSLSPLTAPGPSSRSHSSSPRPSGSNTPNHPPQPPPVLRRTASTSQGHSFVHSSSSAAVRRATITNSHSGVQRSASTGKSASKALALHTMANHPHHHPRPILPKPPGHSSASVAGHLGVPKNGGSSAASRNHSPAGRTASSSSLPSRSGSSGSSQPAAQADGRVSIEVIPSQPSAPSVEIPTLPDPPQVLTPAVDATDPMAGMTTEAEFLAYLNQITSADPSLLQALNGLSEGVAQAQAEHSQRQQQQQQQPTHPFDLSAPAGSNFAFPQSQKPEQDDFYELVARALAEQAQAGQQQPPALSIDSPSSQSNPSSRDPMNISQLPYPQPHSQPRNFLQDHEQEQQQQSVTPASSPFQGAPNLVELFLGYADGQSGMVVPANFGRTVDQTTESAQPTPAGKGLPQSVTGSVGRTGDRISFPIEGFIPGFSALDSAFSMYGPRKPAAFQTPQQHSNGLQAVGSAVLAGGASGPPVSFSEPVSDVNPNLIDLSKPLDAQDVERILRALQQQQAHSAAGASLSVDDAQLAQSASGSSSLRYGSAQGMASQAMSAAGSQMGYSDGQAAGSVNDIPMSQSVEASVPYPSMGEADDLFEKFVFDPAGEGLDLSTLDLGEGLAAGGEGSGMGSRSEIGQAAGGAIGVAAEGAEVVRGVGGGELRMDGGGLNWEQVKMWSQAGVEVGTGQV